MSAVPLCKREVLGSTLMSVGRPRLVSRSGSGDSGQCQDPMKTPANGWHHARAAYQQKSCKSALSHGFAWSSENRGVFSPIASERDGIPRRKAGPRSWLLRHPQRGRRWLAMSRLPQAAFGTESSGLADAREPEWLGSRLRVSTSLFQTCSKAPLAAGLVLQQGMPICSLFLESGRQDLNLRPPGPQPGALPDCATPRGLQSGRRESNPP